MQTLIEALTPRASVFDRSKTDTVAKLTDIASIDADAFFSENFITEAMRTLLPEAFKRLEQREGAAGIFHLTQSMGGGKTHSLVALGLLAKNQSLRRQVLTACGYEPGPLGKVRVVSFSGQSEPTPNGLWGLIAERIGKQDALRSCYTPLRAPTESEWVELLDGEPTLILLDEVPLYFSAIRAVQTGATTLDELTTVALRNLFQVVYDNRLPNVCVVLTDLAGTAYQSTSSALASLSDAEKETNRVAISLSPVNLNSDELYHILRTRLFEQLPAKDEIIAIADAYMQAIDTAQKMGLLADVPATLRQRFIDSYPFHPAIRDLYARVKENASFQQTRALIRIMRIMTRHLWESGEAKGKYLIGAQDYNLLDQSMKSEVAQINNTFEAAIAKDIEDSSGTATAQRLDGKDSADAQDTARLLFLSSLSTAVNPTVGLHRAEIAEYLSEPGRDLARLRHAIDRLQETANYLHPMAGSKLVFRNTENLVAKVEEYVRNTTADMREQELRRRLADLFKPITSDVYQECLALVPLDQVILEADKIRLVIYKPTAESRQAVQEFFAQQTYKNRVCFLTADSEPYLTALERAAYLAAIERVVSEPAFSSLNPNDPQRKQADDLSSQYQSRFYQALSSGFTKLIYPLALGNGLYETEVAGVFMQETDKNGGMRYVCKGEAAVKKALIDMGKYIEEQTPDALLPRLERIWPESQKTIEWNELKRLAATTAGYAWHHLRALEYLREEMVKQDKWRVNDNKWVERGPFAKPPARVDVDKLSVDKDTGRATIRVRPIPSNGVVYHSLKGPASTSSAKLGKFEFETGDLWHSFLCVDPSGQHPAGDPVTWSLQPSVKYGFPTVNGKRQVSLVAEPAGTIRYTIDGSSVETSGQEYTGAFIAAPGALVQARAEGTGVKGEVIQFHVPEADKTFVIDPKKPAVWKREHACDSTSETYQFLELAKKYGAKLGGMVRLTASREKRTSELNTFEGAYEADQYTGSIDMLRQFIPDATITLNAEELYFPSGLDLEDFANALPQTISEGEVEQSG
jgi:hypothetical protein